MEFTYHLKKKKYPYDIGENELQRTFRQELRELLIWDRIKELPVDINIGIDSIIQQYGNY